MKTKLIALLIVLGCAGMASARVVVGVGVGVGPAYGYYVAPPPPYVPPAPAYVAPAPGPNYAWIGGYWYPYGAHYRWHAGYWAARPFHGASWVAPRYYGGRYYGGHWRR